MGKSRLIHEFVHSLRTKDCLVLETNSASYGHAASYLPVIELLRHYYFKISQRDNAKSIREKVTEKILALDPSLQDVIPPLLDLLDALDAGHPFQSLDSAPASTTHLPGNYPTAVARKSCATGRRGIRGFALERLSYPGLAERNRCQRTRRAPAAVGELSSGVPRRLERAAELPQPAP
jgi:hypothetical protein